MGKFSGRENARLKFWGNLAVIILNLADSFRFSLAKMLK